MTVTKQQQLEWLARRFEDLPLDVGTISMSAFSIGCLGDVIFSHTITRQEWQQERDKMQKQSAQQVQSAQPAQDDSWHERGELPPVGRECEAFADGCEPEVCTILAIHNGTAAVKWSKFNNGGLDVITLNGWSFRPLRTERDKAIDEMILAIDHIKEGNFETFIGALYDAGYRKEQSK